MATIILTGGGTAGHCIPNLTLLPYLKKYFDKIYYIGSENGIEREIIENANIPYYYVSCAKLDRSKKLKNLTIPIKVIKGISQAKKLINELKPDVIFSKGGYVSVPTVIAGKKLNIPIILHESDYTIGLANKICARYSEKVLTAFPETSGHIKNGQFIGMPLRDLTPKISENEILKKYNFSGQKPILLVIGGSQGAKAINLALRKSLPNILAKFDVLHVCGKGNVDNSIQYNGYTQKEYILDIQEAYSIASVCITRAGATSLFELMSIKMPCVVIPLPKGASRGDQILNANYFEKLNLITVLNQDKLTENTLVNAINSVYNNRYNLFNEFKKHNIVNKSEEIVKVVCNYIKT